MATKKKVEEGKLMRVRALDIGYDNIAIRNPGDEFEVPETMEKKTRDKDGNVVSVEMVPHTAPWFERVED